MWWCNCASPAGLITDYISDKWKDFELLDYGVSNKATNQSMFLMETRKFDDTIIV